MATAAVRRPHTSLGFNSPTPDAIDPDVKLGEDVLAPAFRDHLENFYLKASPEDRARCVELLTSLDVSKELQQGTSHYSPHPPPRGERQNKRPHTAMAGSRDPINPYTTTYKTEYTAIQAPSAQAERPGTSRHQRCHHLSDPLGTTTYNNEYYTKQSKTLPIRTGTASGNRRNNPHPLESFMVWRLPKQTKPDRSRTWENALTDEMIDQVMRGQITSTYQQDYLGVPQGYQMKSAFRDSPGDWKTKVAYSLDSSTRKTFQKPDLQPELKGNTQRYGCNRLKHMAASGVVPTVSDRFMDLKTRTTYEREYNATSGPKSRDVRDIGRHLGANALEKHTHGASYQDKETLGRMIHTLRPERCVYQGFGSSRSSSRSSALRPVVPPATGCASTATSY